jgi:hypothetical protein
MMDGVARAIRGIRFIVAGIEEERERERERKERERQEYIIKDPWRLYPAFLLTGAVS